MFDTQKQRDDSKSLIVSLVDANQAPDGDWRLAVKVSDGGSLQLRDLMLCNPTGSASTFALMIAPYTVDPTGNGTNQPYVIYLVEMAASSSEIIDLNAAVAPKWYVWVYGSDSAINYHLSGVV